MINLLYTDIRINHINPKRHLSQTDHINPKHLSARELQLHRRSIDFGALCFRESVLKIAVHVDSKCRFPLCSMAIIL